MKKLSKKLVALGLAVAMGVATLAGCGGSSSGTASSGDAGASDAGSSSSGEKVTIKFVHKFPEERRMKYF